MNSICPPDYDNSLVNLSNSFLRHFDCPQWHSTLSPLDEQLAERRCKNVILLVLDGMGMDMLKHNLQEDSFFAAILLPIYHRFIHRPQRLPQPVFTAAKRRKNTVWPAGSVILKNTAKT